MLKRNFIRVFVSILAVVATGCVSSGPIGMDGRVTSINELAARMNDRYNHGPTKVINSQPDSPRHKQFGSFVLTLFNVKATYNDIPDMVNSFRNYCQYRGGIQREIGIQQKNPKSFSIVCEPIVSGYTGDPAYFLFFVNVLLSPNSLAQTTAHQSNEDSHRLNTDARRSSTNADGLLDGYWSNKGPARPNTPGVYQSHRDAYRSNTGTRQLNTGSRQSNTNSLESTASGSWSIRDGYWSYTDANQPKADGNQPNTDGNRYPSNSDTSGSNSPALCVNFLASENRTDRTAFSDMRNYAPYRESFEALLKKSKDHC